MHQPPYYLRLHNILLVHLYMMFIQTKFCISTQIRRPIQQVPTLTSAASPSSMNMVDRKHFIERVLRIGQVALLLSSVCSVPSTAFAFTATSNTLNPISSGTSGTSTPITSLSSSVDSTASTSISTVDDVSDAKTKPSTVIYQSMELPMIEFGVTIPIACWFPSTPNTVGNNRNDIDMTTGKVSYQHRISVRRIGQLLAGWNFIPDFVARNYSLQPSPVHRNNFQVISKVQTADMKTTAPVIFLAHGYLGSRFDLSHLAEELCSRGYICIAAEYPESLAASYERKEGLDRSTINKKLLQSIQTNHELWNNIQATSYGIIGHSLGCGTAIQMGNDKWARVLIAGFPRNRDGTPIVGNQLFITSINDSMARNNINTQIISECNYKLISEQELANDMGRKSLPRRAALFFDRSDAPNHISYLSEGVNDAMIDFLSPLLPLAQALSIPVLDFDKYKESRDSAVTASIVHPLIIRYLEQEMVVEQ
jgi:Chlorophyllase